MMLANHHCLSQLQCSFSMTYVNIVSSKLTRTSICKQLVSVHELYDVYPEHLHFPNILMRQERNPCRRGIKMNGGLWNQRANGNSFCRLSNTKTIPKQRCHFTYRSLTIFLSHMRELLKEDQHALYYDNL